MTRRDAVRLIGSLTAGLGVSCTPLHHLATGHASAAARDPQFTERVLRAFVCTVIPGAPVDSPHLVQVFYDPDDLYKDLVMCRTLLVGDLCRRSDRWYRIPCFDALDRDQRIRVVQSGLDSDLVTHRLYVGAIWASQIAFYGGIWDDRVGCPLIDFEGEYRLRQISEIGYPDPERFLARAVTADGNHP
jgi:hypothetical protein